jgi:hypothetical protein
MLVLALWVISAPFAVMALVSGNRPLNRLLARVTLLTLAVGWAALTTVVLNVVVLGESRSVVALWVAAPLAGLSIWVRGRGEDGDGDDPPPEPDPKGDPRARLQYAQRRRPVRAPARPRGHTAPRRRRPTRVS